jgi:transposase-like protein
MAMQHFLLSAAARTLSLKAVFRMGEDKAYETFKQLRWADTDGEAVCPRCGCVETYNITSRRRFKCVGCHHQFSVTSGTIFASRKLSFTDLLAAIAIFVNGAKGVSALQVSRDLDVQYKTAFVLSHKLREAMALEMRDLQLDGIVKSTMPIRRIREAGNARPIARTAAWSLPRRQEAPPLQGRGGAAKRRSGACRRGSAPPDKPTHQPLP